MSESKNNQTRHMHAAALKYNADKDAAPIVVAAGTGYVAQKIIETAAECGITVYHDDSAAAMLSKLSLGQEIPPDLYQMVVDIYVAVIAAANSAKISI